MAWTNYWLITDGQQGMAVITKEHSKRLLEYTYTVDQVTYSGKAKSDWQGTYSNVHPGEEAAVYYSASHPALSALYLPRIVVEGWPALLVFLLLESLFISTIVNPHGKWALRLLEQEPADGDNKLPDFPTTP